MKIPHFTWRSLVNAGVPLQQLHYSSYFINRYFDTLRNFFRQSGESSEAIQFLRIPEKFANFSQKGYTKKLGKRKRISIPKIAQTHHPLEKE